MQYSIDTSALIDAWVRFYAPDVFPRWWVLFEESIREGAVRASQAVLLELEKKEDKIHAWAKAQPLFVFPIDSDIQKEVSSILANYERLVDTRKSRYAADPFVIALAKLNNACVITGENSSGNINKPNIPDVCRDLNVHCKNLLEFMRELKWRLE